MTFKAALRAALLVAGVFQFVSTAVARADDLQGKSSERMFRVVFSAGASVPTDSGVGGDSNSAAYNHIARIMHRWTSPQGLLRFIFVSDRASVCVGADGCNAEQLMWQRVNGAMAEIKRVAEQSGYRLAFNLVGQAFLNEFPGTLKVPPVESGTAAIDLRIIVEPIKSAVDVCPWRISLRDPDLPPVIGADDAAPAVELKWGQQYIVGEGSQLQIANTSKDVGDPIAVWERDSNELCLVRTPRATNVLNGKTRLHVLQPAADDHEVTQLLTSLKAGCQSLTPKPIFLGGGSGSKGFDDLARRLPKSGFLSNERRLPQGSHCYVIFLSHTESLKHKAEE